MASAAAIAAAQRNARRKQKEADKEARRNARRIRKERMGLEPGLEVEATQLAGYAEENVDGDPMARLNKGDSEQLAVDSAAQGTPSIEYESLGAFGRVSFICKQLTENDTFNGFVIFVILIAGVLVGLQSYPAMETNAVVLIIDKFVLSVFIAECLVKIVAEHRKPWKYFTGTEWKWNVFDFTIVFLSLPIFNWGSSIGLLRLVRLMRLIKLVKRIPQLYMIVMGLIGGMRAIMYILVLLLLIFYMYAVLGYYLFAENDPFEFGDIWRAMFTLWRLSTFEDWTDVLYTNYYSCRTYPGAIYKDDVSLDPASAGRAGELWACANPKSQELFSVLYFISFVFVSSLVMLSLFVGAVTMSMTKSMEDLKEEKEALHRQQALAKARERALNRSPTERSSSLLLDGASSPVKIASGALTLTRHVSHVLRQKSAGNGLVGATKVLPLSSSTSAEHSQNALAEAASNHHGDGRRRSFMSRMPSLSQSFFMTAQDTDVFDDSEISHLRSLILRAVGVEDSKPTKETEIDDKYASHPLRARFVAFSDACEEIVSSARFTNFVTFIIVCAGAQIGFSTFPEFENSFGLQIVDGVILGIFGAEIVLKTLACRFKPWHFFYHRGVKGWNVFDYVVVVGSLIPGSGSTLTILRLLRLLRVLKLLQALPDLQIIVVALINGVSSISYIALILFMVFYIFAIAGQILFAENDPWHFGALHVALMTLFRSATLEDWSDLAYISMYGCDQYGYDGMEELCTSPQALGVVAALYYILFTLIGGLVLMTLFIGVVTMSMEEASANQDEVKAVMKRADKIAEENDLAKETVSLFHDIFSTIDYDGGGSIDEEELAIGFIAIGDVFTKAQIRELVAQVDDDNSGELDFAEFIEFMVVFQDEFLERTGGTGDIQKARKLAREERSKSYEKSNQSELSSEHDTE
ncbi:Voltage-dependent L-type calcium channel subunit alpha-1C [Hondaea fermentalgiana]|uniref:Voltage-dependent L-type calcium channel subunit alpha-1C n=1 Tax=Hondaea fermentalgiana TaxID=2315210 RepID=A0A2R5G834_9STRA|nr:Voltage-dependent L-type calcium channel subunit alpha-1C [Hondaea fermentalgiana]|eukprot:GBG26479.1 Voltage-dependent L-type calcium channel subunit alpha-1C [Hondaea fermentalgiana]